MEEAVLNVIKENQEILREGSSFLEGGGIASGFLCEKREELHDGLNTFLFQFDKVLIIEGSKEGAKVLVDEVDKKMDEKEIEQLKLEAGSFFIQGTFLRNKFETRTGTKTGNLIDIFYRLYDVPSYQQILLRLAKLFENVANTDVLDEDEIKNFATSATTSFKKNIPNLMKFFSELVFDDTVELIVDMNDGVFTYCLKGNLENSVLGERYPGILAYLEHFSDYELNICKAPEDLESIRGAKSVKYTNSADSAFQLLLHPKKHDTYFEINFSTKDKTSIFYWRERKLNETLGKVVNECKFSLEQRGMCLVTLDMKLRIPQLCGTFKCPKIVFSAEYIPNAGNGFSRETGFFFRMFHIEKEAFVTKVVVKPFINTGKLRDLMDENFLFHIESHSIDKPSHLDLDLKVPLVIPPRIVTSCVKLFVRKTTSTDGVLEILRDLITAASKDVKDLVYPDE